jgi:S1-C subfamily serine protease
LTESEGIEMSDELPEMIAPVDNTPGAPVLRREALLPNERSRGLGTVAIVCTMAGVASGLALATTLMAMQVADSMSSRACPYREAQIVSQVDVRMERGFLGVTYFPRDGYADIEKVIPGTPAAAVDLHPGDHVLAVNHIALGSPGDLTERISECHPGDAPTLLVERHGERLTLRPTLVTSPSISF